MAPADSDPLAILPADDRRQLGVVAAVCLGTFVLEIGIGLLAASQALQADALDFAAAGLAGGLSLWRRGQPAKVQAGAALATSAIVVALGVCIAVTTLYRCFVQVVPTAELMGAAGLLALAANGLIVYRLFALRDGETPLQPVWLRARNGGIGNVAVMLAALLVGWLGSAAPDLMVAGVLVALLLTAATPLLLQRWRAWQALRVGPAAPLPAAEPEDDAP